MQRAQRIHQGYGLAAPQLGYSKAIFTFVDGDAIGVAINPELLSGSGRVLGDEGCLSIPGRTFSIWRFEAVTLSFTDTEGRKQVREGAGMLARCWLHEMDHLNGVLICDIQANE